MIEDRGFVNKLIDGGLLLMLIVLALTCLLPFVHVLSVSLSSHTAVSANTVGIWPKGAHIQNYVYMVYDENFINSFGVSLMRVAVGVSLNLLLMVITAYPLSRDSIHMPGRTVIKFLMLFGMMFSGGLIPYFLTLNALGLLNKFWVLVVPGALNIFSTIVVINYFRGIPMELYEAAVLDGANHFQVLFQVFLPISTPVLATVTLFSAVGHWNSWFDGIIYMKQMSQWPLQSYLYSRVTTRMLNWNVAGGAERAGMLFEQATPEGLATAMIIIATFPILLVYPFLQRYFIHGLTLGAVKE
jgi:ABC-type glycerol-3-phosphate transport system permease component